MMCIIDILLDEGILDEEEAVNTCCHQYDTDADADCAHCSCKQTCCQEQEN